MVSEKGFSVIAIVQEMNTAQDKTVLKACSTSLLSCLAQHSPDVPSQYPSYGNMVPAAPPQAHGAMAMPPLTSFAPHPSMMGVTLPPPTTAPHKNEDDDDEDYDS